VVHASAAAFVVHASSVHVQAGCLHHNRVARTGPLAEPADPAYTIVNEEAHDVNACTLDEVTAAAGARTIEIAGIRTVSHYGAPKAEYEDALNAAGLYDARSRGLIEITGSDRAVWLHNLVTNAVKTLGPGEGNYTFATNVKGRILFDGNIIVLADRIWFDIDRRYAAKALAHFERYIITEDVRVTDRSREYCRIALLGPRAAEIAAALGARQAGTMASIGSTTVPLAGAPRLLVRHDSAGVLGLEFYVEAADAAACWSELLEIGRPVIRPVGQTAVDVLRIEAGIPVYGHDIDEDTLPAETQQIERAVSYVKGCYLGQEVVERMRSRGGLARKLVGLKLSGSAGVHPGNALLADGTSIGRLTSVCESYAAGGTIGLGYAKVAHANPGTVLVVESTTEVKAEVASLPFHGAGMH
jgi:folate-binding protein YgfZ